MAIIMERARCSRGGRKRRYDAGGVEDTSDAEGVVGFVLVLRGIVGWMLAAKRFCREDSGTNGAARQLGEGAWINNFSHPK